MSEYSDKLIDLHTHSTCSDGTLTPEELHLDQFNGFKGRDFFSGNVAAAVISQIFGEHGFSIFFLPIMNIRKSTFWAIL